MLKITPQQVRALVRQAGGRPFSFIQARDALDRDRPQQVTYDRGYFYRADVWIQSRKANRRRRTS